jgi:hypothetical protein
MNRELHLHSVIDCEARGHHSTLRIYVHADLGTRKAVSHALAIQSMVLGCKHMNAIGATSTELTGVSGFSDSR